MFIGTYDTFYLYLTSMTFLMTTAFYTILYVAHNLNGDFDRKLYLDPLDNKRIPYSPDSFPWSASWWINRLYEYVVSFNTTVWIVFWSVELVFQG
jgi:hypothetical protein